MGLIRKQQSGYLYAILALADRPYKLAIPTTGDIATLGQKRY